MLIVDDAKLLIMRLRNPNQVKTSIPEAVYLSEHDRHLLAVPHTLKNTYILRNMGIKAPNVLRYYKWPGRFSPFEVQRKTVDFLTTNRRAFVLNDMGTGKTASVLWAFDLLKRERMANKMLVVAPLSTLQKTWGDEAFATLPRRRAVILHGSRQKRLQLLSQDADIYIINHHGVDVIKDALVARQDIDVVVIDEVATYRNHKTAMWKAMAAVVSGRAWAWGLTGTPTPNAPTDAYGQCRLLVPKRVPRSLRAFREMTMVQLNQFKWVPRREAVEVVREAMQPAIRFTRDQCLDLPPVVYMDRKAQMTPEQFEAYNLMRRTMLAEVADAKIVALNEAVKLSKLVQIACGVVYDGAGEEKHLPAATRAAEVREVIEQSEGKTIVFAPYKSVVRALEADLKRHYAVAVITGETNKAERLSIFRRFQSDPSLRVLVASPSAMSHGLTLTEANTIVWYAPVTSNEIYQQANARITRLGQTRTQFIVNISASPVEDIIYRRLKNRQALQGSILEMLQAA